MLARMKTGTRILCAFALAVVVTLAVGAIAWWSERTLSSRFDEVAKQHVPAMAALAQLDEAKTRAARALNGLLLTRADAQLRGQLFEMLEGSLVEIGEARARYEALPRDPENEKMWKQLVPALERWRRASDALADLARQRERLAQASASDGKALAALDDRTWEAFLAARKEFQPLEDATTALQKETEKDVASADEEGDRAAKSGLVTIAVAIAVGALVLVAIGLLLARSIGGVLHGLVSETGKLTGAVKAGKLDVRGDLSAASLEFQPIVAGINEIVEAFVRPIRLTQDYVTRISRGDIPAKISDRYEGDFDLIKEALNRCIDAVSALVQDVRGLAGAAVEGKLQSRADAGRHQGDFQQVVLGVNQTLDAVLAPVQEAREVLEHLARRDLTVRVQGSYQGDHAAIKEAINSASQALHDALGQVAEAVEQVSSASTQIASASQSVASGASEQASSLEETHSSLESMAAQTRQAADNASQANTLADGARVSAEAGAAVMAQMSGAMTKVRASAEGTSAIIKDISEIAFQTNLLALNAAVEAARAGEAGRGFAVVAEEVRSLALRAKEAAVKTEELIKESVRQAGEGESTAKQVNDKLSEILGAAQKVSGIVAEMAASAKEQAAGIEQVNKAVGEMDKVTQQNAASSEEASSAAEELSSQSEELAAMVGSFRLARGESQRKAHVAAAKRTAPAPAPKAKARNGASGHGSIPLRPEEVIPLGSDSKFSDF